MSKNSLACHAAWAMLLVLFSDAVVHCSLEYNDCVCVRYEYSSEIMGGNTESQSKSSPIMILHPYIEPMLLLVFGCVSLAMPRRPCIEFIT